MVRVFIKGGVWKNSEDEILKAAIMKYGKQQWARVASLLNRKSAKQCKARWNEWLDPSVRKVEWGREEDEKLLHLAKLMPAQWRTIGPLVGGRTAIQCQERYEKLLDEAAAAAVASNHNTAGGDPDSVNLEDNHNSSSARRLRPGDIDPHPETKPARPDPIDMDEDEIEMLQEARARLANTQGKKAKRKAREKMLQEAKRLADLQKRRELKQAGLLAGSMRTSARSGKRKKREIDFGVEIPFHKPAPAGFHDTSSEDQRADLLRNKRLKNVDYGKVNEDQYRSRDREERNARKREEARLRALEKSNMEYVVAEVSKNNDPIAARKRQTLNMPKPSITDTQLEHVAKLAAEHQNVDITATITATTRNQNNPNPTDALLGDYTNQHNMSIIPMMKTIASQATAKLTKHEDILKEASDLHALQKGDTPLLGGDNPELSSIQLGNSHSHITTTNTNTTDDDNNHSLPHDEHTVLSEATSKSLLTIATNKTGMSISTPRDELGLNKRKPNLQQQQQQQHQQQLPNDDGDASVSAHSFATTIGSASVNTHNLHAMSIKEMAKAERLAAKRARIQLEEALATLPAPQFEYELATPDAIVTAEEENGEDDEYDIHNNARKKKGTSATIKDAAEIEAEELQELKRQAQRSKMEQSTVIQRSINTPLPRPLGIIQNERVITPKLSNDKLSEIDANELIRREMLSLLQHDAHMHPVSCHEQERDVGAGKKKKQKNNTKESKHKRKRKRNGRQNVDEVDGREEFTGIPPPPDQPPDYIPLETLNSANEVIDSELLNQSPQYSGRGYLQDSFGSISKEKQLDSQIYIENKGWIEPSTTEDYTQALKTEYRAIRKVTAGLHERANKLESKLSLKHGGYAKRANSLRESVLQSFAELQHSEIEEHVYKVLMAHEKMGIECRVNGLSKDVEGLEAIEAKLQTRYGDLIHEKNRLRVQMLKK
eukprot:CAMPEP_0184857660 /NCGR_PEP_ID=MMETSP0580-20130426/2808_1 /TAXON_ID=1118495 /ORGANISM="Dactyliosolen fragilissimus" /LENGTH=944 /DNA_ID=CAMNT_0027353379 /DNA_START=74 /DNA_END=2908 /DNA_ORIENTATION=-